MTYYELYLEDLPDPSGFVVLVIRVLASRITYAHLDLWWPPGTWPQDEIERVAKSLGEVDVLMNAAAESRPAAPGWLEIEFELGLTGAGIDTAAPLLSELLPVAVSARLGDDGEVGTELISVIQDGKRRNLGVWLAADEAAEVRRHCAGFDDVVV